MTRASPIQLTTFRKIPSTSTSLIKSESTVFLVSSSDAKGVNSLRSQLGHGSWTGQLELPLLADGGPFATGGAAFMPMISRYTHPDFWN